MITKTMFSDSLSDEEKLILEAVIKDPKLRIAAARQSFPLFVSIYFPNLEYPCADFHRQFMAIAEDESKKYYVVQASRGFGKSTFLNTYYAIWAILGIQQKKFVLLVAQTRDQAENYMAGIKYELEHNKLLKQDMGPFHEDGRWSMPTIIVENYGARVSIASQDSRNIRGSLHMGSRLDLVILDDVESTDSVRNLEGRNKTHGWFVSDVVPAGTLEKTKFLILSTHLHDDSFVSRTIDEIKSGKRDGITRRFPFLNEKGEPLWKERYPDQKAVEAFKRFIGDEAAFERECMLRNAPGAGQIFLPEWIREFEASQHPGFGYATGFRQTAISVDVSGTNKETSDFNSVIVADVWRYGEDTRIYVMEVYNFHSSFNELKMRIEEIYASQRARTHCDPIVLVESGGTQGWLGEELKHDHLKVEERSVHGMSKEDRLRIASGPAQRGQVWFLKDGMGIQLAKQQLLGFKKERHDDAMDATTQLILYFQENNRPRVCFPGCTPLYNEPFPAEKMLARAQGVNRNVVNQPPADFRKKAYWELTAEELKQLEHEEDVRLMRESEGRRKLGLSGA